MRIVLLTTSLLMFLAFLAKPTNAQIPDFAWAKSAGGSDSDSGYGIAVDGSGNSYIVGQFRDSTATFGGITLSTNQYYGIGGFVVKYDVNGDILWAKSPEATVGLSCSAIAVDEIGNSYVTGSFTGTATLGSATLTTIGSNSSVYIIKYDEAGNVIWAKKAGEGTAIGGSGITIDSNGNIFITGGFSGNATLNNNTFVSNGETDVFVAKYDVNGNIQWAKSAGGIYSDNSIDIAVDADGNSYITGDFWSNSIAFGSNTINSGGFPDGFIAKFDTDGNAQWAKSFGGTGYDTGRGIAVDGNGHAYLTGRYMGSVTFGSVTLYSSGDADVLLVKFDGLGNTIWARSAGGTNDQEAGSCVTVDSNGNSYISGQFKSNSITFGNTTLSRIGVNDIFVAKYDSTGNVIWAKNAGGSAGNEAVSFGLAVDASENCYITGTYLGNNFSFGNTTFSSNGPSDIFIAKLGNNPLAISEPTTFTLTTYPNPFSTSFQITLTGTVPATATLIDMLGRHVHRQVISAERGSSMATITPPINLPSGMYLLQTQQGEILQQIRLQKQ